MHLVAGIYCDLMRPRTKGRHIVLAPRFVLALEKKKKKAAAAELWEPFTAVFDGAGAQTHGGGRGSED